MLAEAFDSLRIPVSSAAKQLIGGFRSPLPCGAAGAGCWQALCRLCGCWCNRVNRWRPARPGGIGYSARPGTCSEPTRPSICPTPFALLLPRQIGDGNHCSQQRANRDDRLSVHGKHPFPEMPPGRMRRSAMPIVAHREVGARLPRGVLLPLGRPRPACLCTSRPVG